MHRIIPPPQWDVWWCKNAIIAAKIPLTDWYSLYYEVANVPLVYILLNKMAQSSNETAAWYVLRVTYQRELIAKRKLDELHIESFVPTRQVKCKLRNGRVSMQRRALVHNYIFIHADRATIDNVKRFELPYLRYVMHNKDNVRQMMTVPEEQMHNFMLITGTEDERLMLLQPESVDIALGTRVRITGGLFAGAEGVLIKVAGARDRRVVVKIDGVAAVATPKIEKELLEIIE